MSYAATSIVAVALLALFVRQAVHYATYTATLAQTTGMLDLTTGVTDGNARIKFVAPDVEGAWTKVTLPRYDLRQHADYEHTVGRGSVHYQIPLTIPAAWRGEPLAFSPRYIGHADVRIWVDGVFVAHHRALRQNAVLTIDLPPSSAAAGRALVAIEGRLDAASEGIFHRSSLYLGPKSAVDRLSLGKTYGMENFYLLFLVGKGAVFIVFAMLFLGGASEFGLGRFLVFAGAATMENLLIGDFLPAAFDLHLRVAVCFPIKMLGITALAAFFAPPQRLRWIWYAGAAATTIMTFAALDFGYGSQSVTIKHLFAVANAAMLTAVVWSLYHAARGQQRLATAVLGAYAALLGYEYLGRTFDGFDYRAIYDLGLFLFAAYLCARALRDKNVMIERQAAEIARHRIHATIAQTTQMLAHDVRKPLNLLEMTANAVARESDPRRASALLTLALPSIRRAKDAADAMIADVMTIGSAMRLRVDAVSVADVVARVMSVAVVPANVNVSADCERDLAVRADPHKFERVIANLIDNALAALALSTQHSGRMTLKATSAGDEVVISLHNTGSYVAPELCERIFEPFHSHGKTNGTGLGLTIVRRFVEAHGGRVVCRSDKTRGTTFEVTWPKAIAPASAGLDVDFGVFVRLFGVTKRVGLAK
jgi:signal transduction histidine kinase